MKLGEISESIGQPGSVFLETVPRAGSPGQTLFFEKPIRIITVSDPAEVQASIQQLDQEVSDGYYVAGFLAYEAGAALHDIPLEHLEKRDLVWFGVYDKVRRLERSDLSPLESGEMSDLPIIRDGRFEISSGDYAEKIRRIKHHIREGDVYQINFTAPYRFETSLSPFELYCRLRRRQRVDYAAIIHTGDRVVLSLSPELFFKRKGDQIVTRPMKGTASRGASVEEDDRIRVALQADAKNTAENLMIVDLLRNDLSRICVTGSVETTDLFTAETYETIIQMTSTVQGTLQDGVAYSDILEALYPSGSITGAPKLRAMEIISEIETVPRGVYCGSVGYIGPDDESVFNVAIRTIELDNGHGTMGIGSGVVWDSETESEYSECLLKAGFLVDDAPAVYEHFVLFETMRFDGSIPLLDRHLARLEASAAHFGFPCDLQYLYAELDKLTLSVRTPSKIRVELDRQGRFSLEKHPLSGSEGILRVALSKRRLDADNPFRRHKTSQRFLYEEEFKKYRAMGFDEVLFLNEQGDVVEGSRTNIFILLNGKYVTPPVVSGALPGVYRQKMLESNSDYIERKLRPEDLIDATKLYICNAVWGWREAVLVAQ